MDALEFIKNTASDELKKNHLKLVFDTYYKLFGEVCTGCPTKISGYINRIKKFNPNKAMAEKKANFVLKQGALIVIRGKSKGYSNANLTDEIAIKFLKGNPNRKALFAKLPKNVDELLAKDIEVNTNDDVTAVKIGEREFTVEQAVENLAAIGVVTKAKTIEGVQKRVDALDEDQKKELHELLSKEDTSSNTNDDVTEGAKNAAAEEIQENTASNKSSDEEE